MGKRMPISNALLATNEEVSPSPLPMTKEETAAAECECQKLRPPTKEEDIWLQERSLTWRVPNDIAHKTRSFDGYGELNYAYFVGDYVTKIWWRNENFQCVIHLIQGSPFICKHDSSLYS